MQQINPNVLGHCTCPECDFPDAEIKKDKNGYPYRYCPDCNVQTFSRNKPKVAAAMLAKMRPLAGNSNSQEKPAPAPAPKAPAPAPKKAGFDLGAL
jgi:hypothetical protein